MKKRRILFYLLFVSSIVNAQVFISGRITDITYQYSLRKHKLDFELRLSNIFNNDVYVSYFTGAFSLMESVYSLRPRELSASVRFRY